MVQAAAYSCLFVVPSAAAFCAAPVLPSAEAVRAAPSRPASTTSAKALPTRTFARVVYVNLADVAADLGLKFTWLERRRKATITGPSATAELEADTRDITVNGLRVFLGDPVVDADGRLYVSRIDYERCLTPLLRPGYRVAARPEPKVIVLDPGHGGRDTGTSANEKVYALDVANRAKKILEASGYTVVLTRDGDKFLDLRERAVITNSHRADLFVTIHFNALVNNIRTGGMEIFTFAPQYQRSADSWSPREKDDTEDFASPVNRFDHWSSILSQAIHRRFVTDLKTVDRGAKLAHWGVLRPLQCPGVLVECGFLTSEAEARKIATPEYRQKIAEAIANGIRDYGATLRGLAR